MKANNAWLTTLAPTYEKLMAHFVRVTIERDAMRAALEEYKRGKYDARSETEKVLVMLGRELFGNEHELDGNRPRGEANDMIVREIRYLRENAGLERHHSRKPSNGP